MPSLPPVASTVRVDLLQTVGANSRVQDRIFFKYTGTPTAADYTTLANNIATSWGTNMAPQLNSANVLTGVRITDLSSNTAPQAFVSTNKPGTGTSTDPMNMAAMVIRFKINRRYRGGHPRIYLSGIDNSQINNATQWSATKTAAVATAFQSFITGITVPANFSTLTHVNVSWFSGFVNKTFPSGRVRSVAKLANSPITDNVIAYSVNGQVGSQRRRNQQSA